jgi:uncharacterized protein
MVTVLKDNLEKIIELCKQHHIKNLYVFGSAVRNDFNTESDFDFLYEMDYSGFNFENVEANSFDPFLVFFDLKEKLEITLRRKVDLIPNQQFKNKYMLEAVSKDKTLIYAAA